MTGKKTLPYAIAEDIAGAGDDIVLGAADISEERVGRQQRAKALQQIHDRADGGGEDDDIAVGASLRRIVEAGVNGAARFGLGQDRRAIAADNAAEEAVVFERKRARAPDQAGADDGELAHSTDLTTEDTQDAEE